MVGIRMKSVYQPGLEIGSGGRRPWVHTCPGHDADRKLLEQIGHQSVLRTYPADVELTRQHEVGHEVIALHDGIIKLVHVGSSGHSTILGLRFGPSVVGLAAAIAGRAAVASTVTLTRCAVETISREHLTDRLNASPDLLWPLMEIEAREVLEQMDRSADVVCCSARMRLAKFLLSVANVQQPRIATGVKLTLPLKRGDLASLIGITPEHLSRLLKELHNDGIATTERGWIVVRSLDQLATEAAEEPKPSSETATLAIAVTA
jgi:CRP/FNR family transcriptional regulator, cyclic AMP receptor protein